MNEVGDSIMAFSLRLQYLKNTLCKDHKRNRIYFWSLHQFLIPQSKYNFFFFVLILFLRCGVLIL